MLYSEKLKKIASILKQSVQAPEPMNPPSGGTTRRFVPDPIPPSTKVPTQLRLLASLQESLRNPKKKGQMEHLLKMAIKNLNLVADDEERDHVGAIFEDLLEKKDIFVEDYEYKEYLESANKFISKFI